MSPYSAIILFKGYLPLEYRIHIRMVVDVISMHVPLDTQLTLDKFFIFFNEFHL